MMRTTRSQDLETNMIAFLPTTKLPAEVQNRWTKCLVSIPSTLIFWFVGQMLARQRSSSSVVFAQKHGGKGDGESYKIGDGLITIFKNYPEELKTAVEDLQNREFKLHGCLTSDLENTCRHRGTHSEI